MSVTLRGRSMNISFRRSKRLEAAAGAEHDALERGVDEVHGQRRLLRDAQVHAAQHAAAADEVDALVDEVLRQLGRRLRQGAHDDVADRPDLLVDRLADLFGAEHDDLRQPGHEVAAADLGLVLVTASGTPEPMASLISSAVRSPIAMPYSRRT